MQIFFATFASASLKGQIIKFNIWILEPVLKWNAQSIISIVALSASLGQDMI